MEFTASSLSALPSGYQTIKVTISEMQKAVERACKATQIEQLTDHDANLVIGIFRRCAPASDWAAAHTEKMTQILRGVTKFYTLAHPNTKILGGDVRSRINTQINQHLNKFAQHLPNDIALIADTEEVIPASALLLIHTSGLFDKLLCASFDESRNFIATYPTTSEEPSVLLHMGGISTAALKTFVEFLTTNQITGECTLDVLAHLLQTSDYWSLNPGVEQAFRKALLARIVTNKDQTNAYHVLMNAGEIEKADACLHNIVNKWSDKKVLGYLEGSRKGLKSVDANKLKLFCQNQVMKRLLGWLENDEKNKKKIASFETLAPQFLPNVNDFGDLSKLYKSPHSQWVQQCMFNK